MCDTLVYFKNRSHSYFAKNSDRNPREEQLVYLSQDPVGELRNRPYELEMERYKEPFLCLKSVFSKYKHPYSAFISRPNWIWGAEMGVNQHGLAIGNEAIFSKDRVPEDGLLGMDILRLALHNCQDATEAVAFITSLIELYGQGGDGGFKSSLKYFNAFLIKDFTNAYIIETSAKKWVVSKVKNKAAISNTYSIEHDYTSSNLGDNGINFRKEYENKIMSFFSKGVQRRDFILKQMKGQDLDLFNIMRLLRSHNSQGTIKRGMKSVCMHSGLIIKSETTSSLIVDYQNDKFFIWFTGAPNPCVSLYRPIVFALQNANQKYLHDFDTVISFNHKWSLFSRKMIANYKYFINNVKRERDELEREFVFRIYDVIDDKNGKDISKLILELANRAEEFRKRYVLCKPEKREKECKLKKIY